MMALKKSFSFIGSLGKFGIHCRLKHIFKPLWKLHLTFFSPPHNSKLESKYLGNNSTTVLVCQTVSSIVHHYHPVFLNLSFLVDRESDETMYAHASFWS